MLMLFSFLRLFFFMPSNSSFGVNRVIVPNLAAKLSIIQEVLSEAPAVRSHRRHDFASDETSVTVCRLVFN